MFRRAGQQLARRLAPRNAVEVCFCDVPRMQSTSSSTTCWQHTRIFPLEAHRHLYFLQCLFVFCLTPSFVLSLQATNTLFCNYRRQSSVGLHRMGLTFGLSGMMVAIFCAVVCMACIMLMAMFYMQHWSDT
jgi:hypothetical protein